MMTMPPAVNCRDELFLVKGKELIFSRRFSSVFSSTGISQQLRPHIVIHRVLYRWLAGSLLRT